MNSFANDTYTHTKKKNRLHIGTIEKKIVKQVLINQLL